MECLGRLCHDVHRREQLLPLALGEKVASKLSNEVDKSALRSRISFMIHHVDQVLLDASFSVGASGIPVLEVFLRDDVSQKHNGSLAYLRINKIKERKKRRKKRKEKNKKRYQKVKDFAIDTSTG